MALIVGVALVDMIAKRHGWPELRRYLAYPEPVEALRRFKRVMAVFGLCMLPFAGYLGMMAVRILRSRQFPYPGMSVWRDTPIARGRPAVIRGWGLAVCAWLLIALEFYAAYIPYCMEKSGHGSRAAGAAR